MTDQFQTPRLRGLDHTIAFLRDGYSFIPDNCAALGTDRFRARIMMSPVLCVRGESAAQMFYGGDRFTRQGAMPPTVLRLLQDKGSVQGLDGAAHRHRKALFVDLLMTDTAEADFLKLFMQAWHHALQDWTSRPDVVLFDAVNLVLTRAICRWVGVPLEDGEDRQMSADLTAMIENAGSIGPAVVKALVQRRGTEKRIRSLIAQARDKQGDDGTPLWRIAHFRDANGALLDPEHATVEVINLLRPTVAVGRFIMFAAMALHDHPSWAAALHGSDEAQYDRFVEEVRRVYPFFPVIGGIAKEAIDWDGCAIAKGDWVLLALYGTNRDPRRFPAPQTFDPARAPSWRDKGYDFIPQGGGDPSQSHRCPGEQLTVAIMRAATRLLVEAMTYNVAPQDMAMPLRRMPARPNSGFVIADVRAAG
jgi:fatty-acid peroxygenase